MHTLVSLAERLVYPGVAAILVGEAVWWMVMP